MPEPVDFRILQNLQTVLKAITVAGGYYYDVNAAAVKLNLDSGVEALIESADGPRPVIVLELGPEEWRYEEAPDGIVVLIPWTINWMQEFDPTIDENLLKTYFRGCADIEKAIAVDIGRGGLATDTRIADRTLVRDGTRAWAVIDGHCSVRRTYGVPA